MQKKKIISERDPFVLYDEEYAYEADTDRFTGIGCYQIVEKCLEDWVEEQRKKQTIKASLNLNLVMLLLFI